MTSYTIRHSDTQEALGLGGQNNKAKTLDILLSPRSKRLVLSEWYVTAWNDETDEIEFQVSADEFVHERGNIAA